MSDVMLFGVLKMPYEMAMASELSRIQFYQRVQELVARFEEQPEQEPWMYRIWNDKDAQWRLTDDCSWPAEPIYTTPPKRPWVRLTFAEICEAEVVATEGFNNFSELKFARAIDAKLKELNT